MLKIQDNSKNKKRLLKIKLKATPISIIITLKMIVMQKLNNIRNKINYKMIKLIKMIKNNFYKSNQTKLLNKI